MEITFVLAGLLVAQQAYYGYMLHTMVNKLMSRNYADYEQSKPIKEGPPKIKVDQGVPEDLSYLSKMDPRFQGIR